MSKVFSVIDPQLLGDSGFGIRRLSQSDREPQLLQARTGGFGKFPFPEFQIHFA
jgi:hypothetical protein